MSCDISTFDVVLLNMLSMMVGLFGGVIGGIRLRQSMLKSRSRDNLSMMNHHHLTSRQPPVHESPMGNQGGFCSQITSSHPLTSDPIASAPMATAIPQETTKQEIVIRTVE